MSQKVQKLYEEYNGLLAKSKTGDKAAFTLKAEKMNEIRQVEREESRAGRFHNPLIRQGKLVIVTTETSSRRSLQEEYVRRFDDKVPVKIDRRDGRDPFVGTLQQFHRDRLLKRA